jgi:hypothetical protein
MKQIQKLIENLFQHEDIRQYKQRKIAQTQYYLEQQRRQYVASAPEGFKARSGADYFSQ